MDTVYAILFRELYAAVLDPFLHNFTEYDQLLHILSAFGQQDGPGIHVNNEVFCGDVKSFGRIRTGQAVVLT